MSNIRPESWASMPRSSTLRSRTPAPSHHSSLADCPKTPEPPSYSVYRDEASTPSVYSFGIRSHFSWSPATTDEATLVNSPVRPAYPPHPPSGYFQNQAGPGLLPLSAPRPSTASTRTSYTASLPPLVLGSALQLTGPWFDLSQPPSHTPGALNYDPCMNEAAFPLATTTSSPPRSTALYFAAHPHWMLSIPSPHTASVSDVLYQLVVFLSAPDTIRVQGVDQYPERTAYHGSALHAGHARPRSATPSAFVNGRTRIDMLGGAHIFQGLSEGSRSNTWIVHTCGTLLFR